MLLRSTGLVRMVVRANQTAAATVVVSQAGGRRVGGTAALTYTCTAPGIEAVAIPLNAYARAFGRAPAWLGVPWSSFDLSLGVQPRAIAPCRRLASRVDLAAVAQSLRVVRGAVPEP